MHKFKCNRAYSIVEENDERQPRRMPKSERRCKQKLILLQTIAVASGFVNRISVFR